MNEFNRMQYLNAMGIEMFVPRKILPAAKMSVACPVSYISTANKPVEESVHALAEQDIAGQISAASSGKSLQLDKGSLTHSASTMASQIIMSGLLGSDQEKINSKRNANSNFESLNSIEPLVNKKEPVAALTLQQWVRQKKTAIIAF